MKGSASFVEHLILFNLLFSPSPVAGKYTSETVALINLFKCIQHSKVFVKMYLRFFSSLANNDVALHGSLSKPPSLGGMWTAKSNQTP